MGSIPAMSSRSGARYQSSSSWTVSSHLREIVDRQWLVEIACCRLHGGHAGTALPLTDAPGLDKCAQDGERQIRVPDLDGFVEPVRQLALARQRAIPFTVVVSEA